MKKTLLLFVAIHYSQFIYADCVPFVVNNNAEKYKIADIILDVGDIFNPQIEGEDRKFHRISNKLHIDTKKYIISRELLFKKNDVIDLRVLAETERRLRTRHFIKEAIVQPISTCDEGIIVQVTTSDNWSLQPGLSFGTSGGKSKFGLELQEKNLFGLGKNLELQYKNGFERTEKGLKYFDPNLFGSFKTLELSYFDNSDGSSKYFQLSKPFIAVNADAFWQINAFNSDLIQPIYQRGEVIEDFNQSIRKYNVSMGRLMHQNDNYYHRLYWGIASDENRFSHSLDYPDIVLADDRKFTYPFVTYELFSEDYIKKTNFNTMGHTEDISLGHHFKAQIGNDFSENSLHFDMSYNKAYLINDSNFIDLNSSIIGIYSNSQLSNTHLKLESNWQHFQSSNKTFFASGQIDIGKNLFADQNQYLGGETGLRGYPFRYFRGDNKLLFTVEQRFFHAWYPLRTFQFASVLFLDSGALWNAGESKQFNSNIGVGFRLIPTRTSGGQVIHFDIGFPTDSLNDVDTYQFQIKVKKSF